MRARSVPAALVDLAKAFATLRVRWYVFGAQAVIAAGVPRLTEDIDVTVEVPAGGAKALMAALAKRRFRLRDVGDVDSFIAQTRVVPLFHETTGMPVDVVLAGPGLEMEMLARAKKRRISSTAIPFVANEDLVALKLLAGREKDLEDVRALVRSGARNLAIDVARKRVADLGELLDDTTLLATFDRIVGRRKKR